jgi:hypothetical protein
MASHEFRCTSCSERKEFSGVYAATRAGWALAEIRFGDKIRYVVACPSCIPSWIKAAISEDAPKKKEGAKV